MGRAKVMVPKWPYSADDWVTASAHRIVVSSGRLLATEIGYARAEGTAPPSREVECSRGALGFTRLYRWGDIEAWLTSRELSVLGPRATVMGVELAPRDWASEIRALQKQLEVAETERDAANTRLRWMTAKTPGLLSGTEILARAVPISSILSTGIYFLLDHAEIVYVGQSKTDVLARIRQHSVRPEKIFTHVFVLRCAEEHTDRLERQYIERFCPKYNSALKPTLTGDGYTIKGTPRKQTICPLGRGAVDGVDFLAHEMK